MHRSVQGNGQDVEQLSVRCVRDRADLEELVFNRLRHVVEDEKSKHQRERHVVY